MKKALIALAAMLISVAAYGQAQVVFNTRVLGSVDAPVFRPDGTTPAGAGYTAQLILVNSDSSLTPLTPTTTFRHTTPGREQYVEPLDITIVGLAPGAQGTFFFRAWETAAGSFGAAAIKGESGRITIATGGGLNPPANLDGLQGFTMVPEPSTIALGVLGAAALLLRRRK